jgi:SPX domain protein involved in polyphosphate accumulation
MSLLKMIDIEIIRLENWCKNKNIDITKKKILEINDDFNRISKYEGNNLKIQRLNKLLKLYSSYAYNENALVYRTLNTFTRKSKKFMVKSNNLIPLILKILDYKKIFTFNPTDECIYQKIYSFYYDDDNFNCYNDRKNKIFGNQIYRKRFYINDENIKNNLEEFTYFIEKKTYKSKENTYSLKERCLFNTANPFSKEIIKKNLKIKTLTEYNRIYFSNREGDPIRFTLDFDIKMRKADDIYIDDNQEIINFDYSILEIKLENKSLNEIEWLKKLIDSNLIEKNEKYKNFSKFVYGIYNSHRIIDAEKADYC